MLVLDEASQIGPRPMLKLLELQARTGMTIKMLGDREQAQAIEAGDTIEILRRALPPEAMPALLTTMRQATKRGQEIAGLFRGGKAAEALAMKRERRPCLDGRRRPRAGHRPDCRPLHRAARYSAGPAAPSAASASARRRTMMWRRSARPSGRGSSSGARSAAEEVVYRAVDQRGQTYDLAIAAGDKLRLFRRTWGAVDGKQLRDRQQRRRRGGARAEHRRRSAPDQGRPDRRRAMAYGWPTRRQGGCCLASDMP